MGGERGGAGEERACHQHGGVHLAECGERQQDGTGGPDEGVDGVPHRIEPGDLVGKELDDEHRCGDADDPGVGECGEVGVGSGEFDPLEPDRQSRDERGEVKIHPGEGGEAEGDAELVEQSHGAVGIR